MAKKQGAPAEAAGRYTIITADSHAGASHATYREYLDPKYIEEFDAWRGRYKNPFKDLGDYRRLRNWDSELRNGQLEEDGIVGEVIFPNTVPPFFPSFVLFAGPPEPEHYERRLAGIRAHNRWLVDFCAELPARRAGVGQIFLNDVDDAIADVRWIKEHGLRGGILLPNVPPDAKWVRPLYDPVYDRLWAVLEELEMPVNLHGGTGAPDYGKTPVAMLLYIAEAGFYSQRPLVHLILGGVLERFPRLELVLTEAGCYWVPPLLERLERLGEQLARLVERGRVLRHPAGLLRRAHHHGAGELVGDGGRDAVDELVGLVDDEDVVLGQHLAALERVDGHEGVVGDDDVDVLGGLAGPFDEALGDERALAAEALVRRHGDLSPRALGHAGDELVAIARVGGRGPLPQPQHLLAQAPHRGVDLPDREQALVVVGAAALELVQAHVVAPALDQGVGGTTTQDGRERVGDPRHVTVDDLRLQGQRRRRDDHRTPGCLGVRHGRDEIGQRLAGARPCLHGEVLARLDRPRHRGRHRDLAGPLRPADRGDREGKQVLGGRRLAEVALVTRDARRAFRTRGRARFARGHPGTLPRRRAVVPSAASETQAHRTAGKRAHRTAARLP